MVDLNGIGSNSSGRQYYSSAPNDDGNDLPHSEKQSFSNMVFEATTYATAYWLNKLDSDRHIKPSDVTGTQAIEMLGTAAAGGALAAAGGALVVAGIEIAVSLLAAAKGAASGVAVVIALAAACGKNDEDINTGSPWPNSCNTSGLDDGLRPPFDYNTINVDSREVSLVRTCDGDKVHVWGNLLACEGYGRGMHFDLRYNGEKVARIYGDPFRQYQQQNSERLTVTIGSDGSAYIDKVEIVPGKEALLAGLEISCYEEEYFLKYDLQFPVAKGDEGEKSFSIDVYGPQGDKYPTTKSKTGNLAKTHASYPDGSAVVLATINGEAVSSGNPAYTDEPVTIKVAGWSADEAKRSYYTANTVFAWEVNVPEGTSEEFLLGKIPAAANITIVGDMATFSAPGEFQFTPWSLGYDFKFTATISEPGDPEACEAKAYSPEMAPVTATKCHESYPEVGGVHVVTMVNGNPISDGNPAYLHQPVQISLSESLPVYFTENTVYTWAMQVPSGTTVEDLQTALPEAAGLTIRGNTATFTAPASFSFTPTVPNFPYSMTVKVKEPGDPESCELDAYAPAPATIIAQKCHESFPEFGGLHILTKVNGAAIDNENPVYAGQAIQISLSETSPAYFTESTEYNWSIEIPAGTDIDDLASAIPDAIELEIVGNTAYFSTTTGTFSFTPAAADHPYVINAAAIGPDDPASCAVKAYNPSVITPQKVNLKYPPAVYAELVIPEPYKVDNNAVSCRTQLAGVIHGTPLLNVRNADGTQAFADPAEVEVKFVVTGGPFTTDVDGLTNDTWIKLSDFSAAGGRFLFTPTNSSPANYSLNLAVRHSGQPEMQPTAQSAAVYVQAIPGDPHSPSRPPLVAASFDTIREQDEAYKGKRTVYPGRQVVFTALPIEQLEARYPGSNYDLVWRFYDSSHRLIDEDPVPVEILEDGTREYGEIIRSFPEGALGDNGKLYYAELTVVDHHVTADGRACDYAFPPSEPLTRLTIPVYIFDNSGFITVSVDTDNAGPLAGLVHTFHATGFKEPVPGAEYTYSWDVLEDGVSILDPDAPPITGPDPEYLSPAIDWDYKPYTVVVTITGPGLPPEGIEVEQSMTLYKLNAFGNLIAENSYPNPDDELTFTGTTAIDMPSGEAARPYLPVDHNTECTIHWEQVAGETITPVVTPASAGQTIEQDCYVFDPVAGKSVPNTITLTFPECVPGDASYKVTMTAATKDRIPGTDTPVYETQPVSQHISLGKGKKPVRVINLTNARLNGSLYSVRTGELIALSVGNLQAGDKVEWSIDGTVVSMAPEFIHSFGEDKRSYVVGLKVTAKNCQENTFATTVETSSAAILDVDFDPAGRYGGRPITLAGLIEEPVAGRTYRWEVLDGAAVVATADGLSGTTDPLPYIEDEKTFDVHLIEDGPGLAEPLVHKFFGAVKIYEVEGTARIEGGEHFTPGKDYVAGESLKFRVSVTAQEGRNDHLEETAALSTLTLKSGSRVIWSATQASGTEFEIPAEFIPFCVTEEQSFTLEATAEGRVIDPDTGAARVVYRTTVATKPLTIHKGEAPTATISITDSDEELVRYSNKPGNLTLTANTNDPRATYSWHVNNSLVSTAQSFPATYMTPNERNTIELVVKGENCQEARDTHTLETKATPPIPEFGTEKFARITDPTACLTDLEACVADLGNLQYPIERKVYRGDPGFYAWIVDEAWGCDNDDYGCSEEPLDAVSTLPAELADKLVNPNIVYLPELGRLAVVGQIRPDNNGGTFKVKASYNEKTTTQTFFTPEILDPKIEPTAYAHKTGESTNVFMSPAIDDLSRIEVEVDGPGVSASDTVADLIGQTYSFTPADPGSYKLTFRAFPSFAPTIPFELSIALGVQSGATENICYTDAAISVTRSPSTLLQMNRGDSTELSFWFRDNHNCFAETMHIINDNFDTVFSQYSSRVLGDDTVVVTGQLRSSLGGGLTVLKATFADNHDNDSEATGYPPIIKDDYVIVLGNDIFKKADNVAMLLNKEPIGALGFRLVVTARYLDGTSGLVYESLTPQLDSYFELPASLKQKPGAYHIWTEVLTHDGGTMEFSRDFTVGDF